MNDDPMLPADPDHMNGSRAEWAGSAVVEFQRKTGSDNEDALCDLLCDLMHWADYEGYDFEAALLRAQHHYLAETGQPGPLSDRLADECHGYDLDGNPIAKED